MKKVLLISAILALAVPSFAANLLTNGDFENGLTGWTVVQDLSPWGGSVQTPVQTASSTNPLKVMEGVDDGVDPFHFADTGQTITPGVSLQYGTSAGVSRAGWKAYPGTNGDPWEGTWTWVSQTLTVAPGEYYVMAEWDTFSFGGGDYSQAVVAMAFGDDPYDGVAWDVGWYGNDNDPSMTEPPKVRASAWNHQTPAGSWTHKSWTVASNKKVTTYSGNIEFRWVFKDKGPGSLGLDAAQYSLLDNASADLQLIRLVPEPSSLLALATGLLGLGGLALRRRR